MADIPEHPKLGAPLIEWVRWVDAVVPFKGRALIGGDLAILTQCAPRDLAAVTAEQWFRQKARDQIRTKTPKQSGFGW